MELTTQNQDVQEGLNEWDAIGALLLVAALVVAIFWALSDPSVEHRYTLKQGKSLLSEGRYSEAASLLERTLPLYDTPEGRLNLSYAYLARRDAERAERQARLILTSASPGIAPTAWAQLGRIFAFTGHKGEALDAWSKAAATSDQVSPDGRSSTWQAAVLLWKDGDYQTARRGLESLLNREDVYSISARVKLAQLLAPTDSDISRQLLVQVDESFQAGKSSIIESRLGAAVPNLGLPQLEEGLSEAVITRTMAGLNRAMLDVEKAKKGGADQSGIDAVWGSAYLQQGEYGLAKTYLERAVAQQPNLADAHSYLGLALTNLGDTDTAIAELQKAVELSPERPLPHYILAQIYIGRKDWDHASAELSALKKLEPDSVQLHIQLAEYYAQRGAYDPAEEEYTAAVQKQRLGNSTGGLNAALALALFYTDLRGQGCDKGLPAAQESLSQHPNDPASLDAVGWALVQCNKPAEALSSLEKAVQSSPDNPRYIYHLGKAYARLQRPDDARAQYARVIDLDPGGSWEREAVAAIANLQR